VLAACCRRLPLLADADRKTPFTADMAFDIRSITKQLTAAAILKLEMQGKLSVQDPIGKWFDGVPEDKKGITIHHLLTHSSGLEDVFGDDYEEMPRDELVKKALASQLLWAPGTKYRYSNAGYSLLGAIVASSCRKERPPSPPTTRARAPYRGSASKPARWW